MLSFIKRAWVAYLAAIPAPEEREQISDEQIRRQYFRAPPVPAETKACFRQLAELVHAHLDPEAGKRRTEAVVRRLKPGVEAVDALADGLFAGPGHSGAKGGFIGLDWKAREEVLWQAHSLCRAHGIASTWNYDWQGSQAQLEEADRQEVPVEAPLRDFGHWLRSHGKALVRFAQGDSIVAFAVDDTQLTQLRALCCELGIVIETCV